MPIPEISFPQASAAPRVEEAPRILNLIKNIEALRPATGRPRMAAFIVDLSLLYGVSIKVSQWIGILMLRSMLHAKHGVGAGITTEGFQFAYEYSIVLIWPIALLFAAFAYYVSCTHAWGATLGQGLMGLRVVTKKGELPSLERAGKRFFGSLISVGSFGVLFFLGAYGRTDGICFHDDASGTRVVRRDSWRHALWSPVRGVDAEPAMIESPERGTTVLRFTRDGAELPDSKAA